MLASFLVFSPSLSIPFLHSVNWTSHTHTLTANSIRSRVIGHEKVRIHHPVFIPLVVGSVLLFSPVFLPSCKLLNGHSSLQIESWISCWRNFLTKIILEFARIEEFGNNSADWINFLDLSENVIIHLWKEGGAYSKRQETRCLLISTWYYVSASSVKSIIE